MIGQTQDRIYKDRKDRRELTKFRKVTKQSKNWLLKNKIKYYKLRVISRSITYFFAK